MRKPPFMPCLLAILMAGWTLSAWSATRFGPGGRFPQMQTRAIAHDSRGVLWWGTEDELIRFDGHRVIPVELPRLGELDDRGVRALLATATGMYVATNYELRHVDRQGQRQQRVTSAGRGIDDVHSLVRHQGGEYAITSAGRLYRLQGAAPAATAEPFVIQGWPDGLTVRGVHPGDGALYFSSSGGIYRIDLHSRQARLVDPGVPGLSARAHAAAVHEDAWEIWLGYWNDGLVRIDRASGSSRWYGPEAQPGRPRTQSIQTLVRAPDGRLLIGTNHGLVIHDRACDCLSELKSPDWGEVAGQGVIVFHMLVDASGLWASTPQALYRFEATDFAFHYLQKTPDGSGLASTAVHGLAAGEERLWLAGYGGGLEWMPSPDSDPAGWHFEAPPASPEGAMFVWDIAPHPRRSLLATGWGLYALEDGQVRLLQDEVQSLRRVRIEDDGVLIGAIGGLYRWHQEKIEPIEIDADGPPAVWDFLRDGDTLWVATESGLFARDPGGRVRRFGPGAAEQELPGSAVFRIEIAADGRRWLATNGGLVEWRSEGGRQRFLRQEALVERNIRQVRTLTSMPDGELWLGTPQGIVRFRPPQDVRVFNANDGVLAGQYWPRGALRVGERVFVANATGVVHFKPRELELPPLELRPQALRWRVDQGAWQDADQARLRPGQRALAIEFWSGVFGHAEEIQYEFSLRGRDREYRSLGAARELLLEDLRPGDYELWLRARLRHEPLSVREGRVLAVHVLPAWFQHPLGRALLAALGLLALYAVVFVRERWARQRASELRALVDERTAELARANAQLQSQALQDPLTGLANRRRLFEFAGQTGAAGCGLLLIDIDHFKVINDRFGHRIGDRALVALAGLLQRFSQDHPRSLAVRNGGEEFLLLLPGAQAAQAVAVAQRLLGEAAAIELRGEFGEPFNLTLSIGVAVRAAGETIDSALHRADKAMYRAKQEGRARLVSAEAQSAGGPGQDQPGASS